MISHIRYSLKFLSYFLFSKHKKGHGIHSPFVYSLISKVFLNKDKDKILEQVIHSHNKYLKSKIVINYNDIGAGSVYKKKKQIKLCKLIKRSSVNKKYGKLIYDILSYFNPKNILEIGSSVGISSSYIAQAGPNSTFKSIEGVKEKIQIARKMSDELNQHTDFIHGNFDVVLSSVVSDFNKLDFVFFDGNHTKQNTLNYFECCLSKIHNDSVFVFDDIHWSKEMEEAWETIKNNKKVKVSIDIFRMGLIFFKKELSYQQYVIKF